MRTTSDLGASVPAFLAKLWKMVEDPETDYLISWSPNGKSFFIKNQSQFTSELLPYYYKHGNMASFIRQLNMYGFHKKVSVELGGLKCDKDEIEFAHQYFCKGYPHLVDNIKRKVTSNKNQDLLHSSLKPEVVNMIFTELREMKERQNSMNDTVMKMKRENSTLWTELAMLTQKHLHQKELIDRLIQFLVSLVQPPRSGISVKRRRPLMINDSSRLHKQFKLSKSQESPTGPIIHEVDTEPNVDSDYIVIDMLKNENSTVQSPQEHTEILTDEENSRNVYTFEDIIQNLKIETKRKRVCKDKKKKKLHMLEILTDEDEHVSLLKHDSIGSKPVPTATVRSSKLAAMAARIESQDADNDVDSVDLEDTMEVLDNNPSIEKLENLITPEVLINSEMFHNSNIQNNIENEEDSNSNPNMNNRFNQMDSERIILVTNNNEQYNENKIVQSQKEDNSYDRASASSLKDLLVSRVNSSGMTEANYRLEPTEELNNHVETTQNNLDTFREILLSENCNLDANTFLDVFNTDDPFGLSSNSELNPYCGKEENISDSVYGSTGVEFMTYNPPLELNDDMFMGNNSNLSDLQMNGYTHSMNYENSKKLLDDLIANNTDS
ncbi:heat shock factor protein isoform X2 [Mycetomoellerius zeteki]|uniref:heat shock factor protein isoform X2 n=1 Tax=Mycetomoellerius zeteki TaxID=64791 RepID=UPI00084E4A15|nr:PREDICTED: heat shock factor protein-like isoform X2 [Trachymyrmex zeteki]